METIKSKKAEILDTIKRLIKIYNASYPEESLTLGSSKENGLSKEANEQSEKIDVKDIYVCLYNTNEIGLFKKDRYSMEHTRAFLWHKLDYDFNTYGEIYFGYNTSNIGLVQLSEDGRNCHCQVDVGCPAKVGEKLYFSNVLINNSISFEDLRIKMAIDGQLGEYTLGQASHAEIIKVLTYAPNYFDNNPAKIKTI